VKNVPQPWERLLWTGRPLRLTARVAGERLVITDFRLVHVSADRADEIALDDIGDIRRVESRLDRLLGTSTLVIHARRSSIAPLVLTRVRRGAQMAAILDLLAADPTTRHDDHAVRAALTWEPPAPVAAYRGAAGALAAMFVVLGVFSVAVVAPRGRTASVIYDADDAVAPGGVKRSRQEIVRFMERDVMPWARATLGRIKGGPDRVTCATCHGLNAAARDWQMPAVAALPQPDVKDRGWETFSSGMNAQMRNAIYGYLAESDNQAKAAYMREFVVPGMASVLHRPAYDFTKPYGFNRSRNALGCYHCHRVS
jgi:hypothetical protein